MKLLWKVIDFIVFYPRRKLAELDEQAAAERAAQRERRANFDKRYSDIQKMLREGKTFEAHRAICEMDKRYIK